MIFSIANKEIKELRRYKKTLDAHAKFAPSSASSWLECPAFAFIDGGEAGEAALKGREAHAKEEEAVKEAIFSDEDPQTPYSKYVMSRLPKKGEMWIEETLHSKFIGDSFFGTGDCIIWDEENKSLEVIDLKTGRIEVSPKYNIQAACYTFLFDLANERFNIKEVDKITHTIFQYDKPFSWEIKLSWYNEVIKEVFDFLKKYKDKKELKEEFFNPSKACSSCWRKGQCPSYNKNMTKEVAVFQEKQNLPLSELNEKDFVSLWEMSREIKKYIKSIDDELDKRADKMTLMEKKITREVTIWKNKKDALKDKRFLKEDLIKPSEAKKLMNKKELEKYITKRKDKAWTTKN